MSEIGGISTQSISLEVPFHERNHDHLPEYVEILGVDPAVVQDLDTLVAATQPWVKGDHTRPEELVDVTPEQSDRLHELCEDMLMKQEFVLPDGHYDSLVVLGGMHLGNHRRIDYAKRMLERPGITTDRIIMLGGERPVYPESEAERIADNTKLIQQYRQTDPFIQQLARGARGVKHESDMLRLAASIQLGNLVLKSESERVIEFDWEGMPVTLTHTASVARKDGDPRHTTEACLSDLLKRVKPAQGAKLGFIATNPHVERTARSSVREINKSKNNRGDIELVLGGPSALDSYSHELFRGEVARNLYEDQQAA